MSQSTHFVLKGGVCLFYESAMQIPNLLHYEKENTVDEDTL